MAIAAAGLIFVSAIASAAICATLLLGFKLGIRGGVSHAAMTRASQVGVGEELANASEVIGIVAVKARPLDRAYHFAVLHCAIHCSAHA